MAATATRIQLRRGYVETSANGYPVFGTRSGIRDPSTFCPFPFFCALLLVPQIFGELSAPSHHLWTSQREYGFLCAQHRGEMVEKSLSKQTENADGLVYILVR